MCARYFARLREVEIKNIIPHPETEVYIICETHNKELFQLLNSTESFTFQLCSLHPVPGLHIDNDSLGLGFKFETSHLNTHLVYMYHK